MKKINLLTTRNFNGIALDCYKGDDDDNDFWATREQIGQLLGYDNPNNAITIIHKRNPDRLNKFSTSVNLTHVEGTRTVTRKVIVYNFKGLLEICRYSNQPAANAVIDFLWEIADDIRKNGMYLTDKAMEAFNNDPEAFKHIVKKYTELHKKNQELSKKIEADRPFVLLGQIVLANPGAMTLKDASDLLAQHGIDIGQNRFFQRCRQDRMLCSRKGQQWNKPTRKAIERGLFNLQISGGNNTITMITPKGLQHYGDIFMGEEFPLLALSDSEEKE